MSISEICRKQREEIPYLRNSGLHWTVDDVIKLLKMYADYKNPSRIAAKLERSDSAVRSKIISVLYEKVTREGCSVSEMAAKYHVNEKTLQNYVNKRNKSNKINKNEVDEMIKNTKTEKVRKI